MDSQQDEDIKTHGGCGPRFCSWSPGRRHLLRLSALYSLSGQRALQLGMSFTGRDAPGLIPGLWAIAVGPASGRHSFSLTLSRCMVIPRRPQARGLLCPRPPLPACTVGKPHVLRQAGPLTPSGTETALLAHGATRGCSPHHPFGGVACLPLGPGPGGQRGTRS